ncbi:MAG TPA: tetratricopeptide repeat protein [Proteobacteria bacterium]|nr:photosystem I assembly protein Ycf3 [bacterium BMS3Abin14]HDL54119.1 tetratricopeptide repeat protein [Pseudomonadota bacterium]
MGNKNTFIVVIAALIVGLMVGILGPKLFGSRPAGTSVVSSEVPPQAPPPSANYTLKINELKNLLQNNPNNVGALIQLGNAYFDSNQYKKSINAYEKALALKPGNPDVLTDLGVMYRRNGQPGEAVRRFKEAIKVGPTHLQSRMNLGVVLLYDLKDPVGARAAFEDFLRISPSGPQADKVRGIIDSLPAPGK